VSARERIFFLVEVVVLLFRLFVSTTHEDEFDMMCSICLDNFTSHQKLSWSRTSRCQHVFHSECLLPWLMDHDDCPICRSLLLQYDDDDNDNNDNNDRGDGGEGVVDGIIEATITNSQVLPSNYSNHTDTIGNVDDDFDIESQSPSRNEGGGEQMNDDGDDHRSDTGTATILNTLLSIVLRRGHRSGGVHSSYSHDQLGQRDIPQGERTPPRQVEERGAQEDVDNIEMGSCESAHECEAVGSSSSSDGNGEMMIGLGGGDGSTIGDHDGSGRNTGRQKQMRDSKRYHSLNP